MEKHNPYVFVVNVQEIKQVMSFSGLRVHIANEVLSIAPSKVQLPKFIWR